MTDQKHCQPAVTPPACPDSPTALVFTPEQLATCMAAGEAYRRLLDTSAASPDWPQALQHWQRQAEAVALLLLNKVNHLKECDQ